MTVIFTDRPLEERFENFRVQYYGLEDMSTVIRYGCLYFLRRDDLLTNKVGCEADRSWFFGDAFKDMYCYHFRCYNFRFNEEFHNMYSFLYLLVQDYLKWGNNIVIYDCWNVGWLMPEVPVSKIDISTKDPGEALIYSAGPINRDILYWFFDSGDAAKDRDTDLLFSIGIDVGDVVDHMGIPCIDGDGVMTVADLMKTCGNSMSMFAIYDLSALDTAIEKYGDMDGSDDREYVKALEVVRCCEEPHDLPTSKWKYENTRFDGMSEFSDHIVKKYWFSCSSESRQNTARFCIWPPVTESRDVIMFVMIDKKLS